MFTKISKNLIVFSVIAFSFIITNIAFADSTIYAFSRSNNNKFNIAQAEDMGYSTVNYFRPVTTTVSTNQATSGSVSNESSSAVNNNTTSKTSSTSNTTSKTTNVTAVKTVDSRTTSVTPAKELNGGVVNTSNGTYNRLGASAYSSVNSAETNSFMPNTFWGWLLVVLLILAIVILYRMIARKSKEVKMA